MTRRYVNQFAHQETIDQVFLASEKQLRPNRNGDLYLRFDLSDRTGAIGPRMWNASETVYKAFEDGDYVRVEGTTQLFQGAIQLIATRLCLASIPVRLTATISSPSAPSMSTSSCCGWAKSSAALPTRPCGRSASASSWTRPSWRSSSRAPAGVENHHAYHGGLLEHVVSLMEVVLRISPCIRRSTAICSSWRVLHNLGRVRNPL